MQINHMTKRSYWLIIIVCLSIGIQSCNSPEPNQDVKDIELELDVERTDQRMHQCAKALKQNPNLDDLEAFNTYLKPEVDFLYEMLGVPREAITEEQLAKEIVSFLRDSHVAHLLDTIQIVFPDNFPLEEKIAPIWKRIKLHFPNSTLPRIRTHVNGFTPNATTKTIDQILPTPNYFSVGLHYFLGEKLTYYPPSIPVYIRKRFDPEYMETMVVKEVAEGIVPPFRTTHETKLLDQIVHSGIKQYVIDRLIPHVPDSLKLFYSSKQMEWAEAYEKNIYNELIPHLYKNDASIYQRYLTEKPYTTHLSQESAPRLGQYMGWKIVSKYMEKFPETSLEQLSDMTNYEEIFKRSKYKP